MYDYTVPASKYRTFWLQFDIFRGKLFFLHRIRRMLDFVSTQLGRGVYVPATEDPSRDQFRYRSVIYTLLYANYISASFITNQERLRAWTEFDLIDTRLILRAMLERYITQKFILTDPIRLADMFVLWGDIEKKRFHVSREKIQEADPEALALNLGLEGFMDDWSLEREERYRESSATWEALSHQNSSKSKSWSGLSLAEMARQARLEDLYKLIYRESSWYSHGLVDVSDFFLRITDQGAHYSASTSQTDRIFCYLDAENLLLLSFECADQALDWNAAIKLRHIRDKRQSPLAWISEYILRYWL